MDFFPGAFGGFGGKMALADPWAVVADFNDRTIHTIDLGTSPPMVYGPFLSGQLGGSGSLIDVAVTPDGRFALVSNFDDHTVYKIDLTDPTSPSLAGSANIGFAPEDIAITPDGIYALVTDGWAVNRIALLRVSDMSLINTYTLTTSSAGAECVATDGRWVVVCDSDNDRIIYGAFDESNVMNGENTLSTGDAPLNAVFSPDRQTLLVANDHDGTVTVYQVSGSGITSSGSVSGLPGGQQSLAFSPDGTRAYVISDDPSPDQLSWLSITGPGSASQGGAGVANLLSDVTSGFLGVDVLAVTPDGRYALAGNPSTIVTPSHNLARIDLNDFSVSTITVNSDFPAGIAIFSRYTPGPTAVPTMNEWGVILLALGLGAVGIWSFRRREALLG